MLDIMGDPNILFDPKMLTENETKYLINKITDYSAPVGNSTCKNWSKEH